MFEQELLSIVKKISPLAALQTPPDDSFGDYSMACFFLAKEMKKSPVKIAEELASSIKKPDFVERIESKNGYVNFFLKKETIAETVLSRIISEKNNYGHSNAGKGKTIVIDYSHPNVAKPFGIGHLRSTVIGNALVKMLQATGYKVVRLNYLGDWGTPFGKYIEAFKLWGSQKELEANPIKHLYGLYVKYNKEAEENEQFQEKARNWFKKLEEGDKDALKLWKLFREVSLKEFMRIYKILGVDFDSYDGEYSMKDNVDGIIKLLEKKGLTKIDKGALIVELEGTPLMLRKSDEASTYASRDLAAIKHRIESLKADILLYIVGNEQALHFQQVFNVAKKLNFKQKMEHIKFGLYLDSSGKKMATRKGTLIMLDQVLNETIALALRLIKEKNPELKNKEQTANDVGVGAVIFGDLVNDRIKDVVFDWEKIVQFEGDTGPYLQYTHARACNILAKASPGKPDFSQLKEDIEKHLIIVLSKYPEIVAHAVTDYKPHILAQYLLETGHAFNEFYHACPVIKADENIKNARLHLVKAASIVLSNGLGLLGIKAPAEM